MATYNIQMKKRNGSNWDELNPITLASNVKINNTNVQTEITNLKNPATGTANGLMSAADKKKLDGIANNANNYVHPNDSNNRHVSDAQITNWNDKYTKNEIDNKINTLTSGLAWKESVENYSDIATTYPNPKDGWTVNVKSDDITYRYTGSAWIAISANAIPVATQSVDGKMSKEDKKKLDDLNTSMTTAKTDINNLKQNKADLNHTHNYLSLTGGTVTGSITAPSFIGALNGNANTATTLRTARSITIGSSTKTFNGGADITWSLTDIGAAASNHTHSYLPLSGGAVTGSIKSSLTTSTYLSGNQGNALLASTANAGAYTTLLKSNSTNGYFTLNSYQTRIILGYTAKSTVDAGTNGLTYQATLINESGDSQFPGTVTANTFKGALNGNASTATKLSSARTITLTGAISGSGSFDGSSNITITTTGSNISNIPSSAITSMNGYTKATSVSAITTSDTLNVAIGKLEKALDAKASSSHTHSYAGSSSAGGAATSAVKLATARTINGTNFDGSANIITANWGTARNIQIGNTSKSVNGSANISWSLTEIGAAASNHTHSYLPLGGGTVTGAIKSSVNTGKWLTGNQGTAIISSTNSAGALTSLIKSNSTNGYFTLNNYEDRFILAYTAKTVVDAGTNTTTLHADLLNESGNSKFPGTVTASSFIGNSTSATKLQTARTISLTGGVTGSITFDGSANVSIATTVSNMASNKITAMTGYSKPSATSAILATDSLNVAIGKLEKAIESKSSTTVSKVTLTETIVEKTVTSTVTTLAIGQTVNTTDIVRVYLGGVRLFEGKTYTLTKGTSASIAMTSGNNLQNGDIVTFEIVRATLS